jgi:acetyl/propionyl-CoA carboxylase alpha subunit
MVSRVLIANRGEIAFRPEGITHNVPTDARLVRTVLEV